MSIQDNTDRPLVFLVSGANNGIGLEATRQLAANEKHKVYMLCRSDERAKSAIVKLGSPKNVQFVPFDACECSNNPQKTTSGIVEDFIDGVLLNAGGFGESLDPAAGDGASKIAQLILLGHVNLVNRLMEEKKLREGSRIVASGSEGCYAGPELGWKYADFKHHLQGKDPDKMTKYVWMKGMVALYWSAFARRHPELYVATISPGAVKGTNFYKQKGMPGVVNFFAKIFVFVNGSNSVEEGASRYLDALLNMNGGQDIPSGSFFAHRKGYASDFGDVTELKNGAVFGDETLQDLVSEAVQDFV